MLLTEADINLLSLSINELHEIINSRNRSRAGESVKGEALFLESVEYPEEIFISSI